MAILKNTTINDTGFLKLPSGSTAQRPGSPTVGMFRYNTDYKSNEYYNGTGWVSARAGAFDGLSAQTAAPSAEYIKAFYPSAPDGVYWIDLPSVGPTQLYCIMDSAYNGGGWMMAMKATRGTTFNFNSSYWTSTNTLNTSSYNINDGDAKFESFNRYAAKDLLAVWPDLTSNTGCFNVSRGLIWLENNFWNSGARITLTNLFNSANEYFIRDANTFCGIGPRNNQGFSSQVDVRFYGFNYSNDQNLARVRWGFGWNENGGGLWPGGNQGSDDVSGGIGMTGTQQGQVNYSAGDFIGCCQNVTGFNRSARVEMYIR